MRKLSEQVAVEKGGHEEALEALAAQHDDELAQAGRVLEALRDQEAQEAEAAEEKRRAIAALETVS